MTKMTNKGLLNGLSSQDFGERASNFINNKLGSGSGNALDNFNLGNVSQSFRNRIAK